MITFTTAQKAFKERTTLEKTLLIVTLFLLLSVIALIIVTAIKTQEKSFGSTSDASVCRTKPCLKVGSALFRSLDTNADPCEDFYTFCCGSWVKNQKLPDDLSLYGMIEQLRDDVNYKIKELLTSKISSFQETIAQQNAIRFYKSCMNEGNIEKRGSTPLRKFLSEIGGWPVIDKGWKDANYDWLSAVAEIQRRTSFGYIILLMIGADDKNTSINIMQLDQPSLSISRDFLLKNTLNLSDSQLKSYKDLFSQIAILLGAKNEGLDEEFLSIIEFEKQIAEMMQSEQELQRFEKNYNKMKITDLQKQIPEIEWLRFLQEITNASLSQKGEQAIVNSNEYVIVPGFEYLKKIGKFLKNKSLSRQVANYLGWRVILSHMSHMPSTFGKALQDYIKQSGYIQRVPDRWKICITLTNNYFHNTVASMYVKEYFPEETKKEVMKLSIDLKFEFEMILRRNDWMDEVTKKAALEKLKAMSLNLGYPDWITDDEALSAYYIKTNKPNMTDDVFENDCALTLYSTENVILRLREKNVEQQWAVTPITVNAGYRSSSNGITFPAAFLQHPLFNRFLPSYYNYAAIGAIFGHEMTHGFDNNGRKRDAEGNVKDWWSKKSKQIFQEREKCFTNQYQHYQLNGLRTLAENIADNGGLRQSYAAFSRWKEAQQNIMKLSGLEQFSLEQQFFIIYGSIWCTKYRTEAWNVTVHYAPHAPAPYRLMGTVSNLKEFAEAFQCKPNSTLNPEKRCVIW